MVRLSLAFLVTAGCVTPAFKPIDDDSGASDDTAAPDSAAPTDDTSAGDDTVADTYQPDTYEPADTSDPLAGLPSYNCHPFDPVAYGNWQRRYNVSFGSGNSGRETHTPINGGQTTDVPNKVQNVVQYPQAYGYNVQVRNAGSNNYTGETYMICNGAGAGRAIEVATKQTVSSGFTNTTVVRGATEEFVYLPLERNIYSPPGGFNWSWTGGSGANGTVRYKEKLPGACGTTTSNLDVTTQFEVKGFERLTVGPLGPVDALHIQLFVEQVGSGGGGGGNPFCQIFQEAFSVILADLFGFNPETGEYTRAQIDRWYVRGVGLVKEEAVDATTRTSLFDKELIACSGLPECP